MKKSSSHRVSIVKQDTSSSSSQKIVTNNDTLHESVSLLRPTKLEVKESRNQISKRGGKKQTTYQSAVDLRRSQLIDLPQADKMKKSDVLSVDSAKFFKDCMHNVNVVLRSSVAPGSESTYGSGWTHWKTFVVLFGTDEFLFSRPKDWLSTRLPYSFIEVAMSAYIIYLQSLGKAPSTISTYTFGVIYNLRCNSVDVEPLNGSKLIMKIKSGVSHLYRQKEVDLNALANTRTMPINVVMLLDIKNRMFSGGSIFHKCLSNALFAAFVYLFRPSEFIITKNSKGQYHYIRTQDVMFTVKEVDGNEKIIPSSDAYLYAFRFQANKWDVLVDVMTSVRDAKNDPNGIGSRYVHNIEQPNERRAFCIATVMFETAIMCRPQFDYPFFSCPSEQWRISEDNVSKVIRASAKHFFNDPLIVEKFTPRSLRVGGASALMAAGSTDSFIQKAGRWKSTTFLEYLRVCTLITQEYTVKACQVSGGFSIDEIKKKMSLPVGAVRNWN